MAKIKTPSAAPAPNAIFRKVADSTLDFAAIDDMAAHDDPWLHSSRLIREPVFFTASCRPRANLPGPLSSLGPTLTTSFLDMGIHVPRPSGHNEPCAVQLLFGVYKDEQHARLIQWPETLNRTTPDLTCALPLRKEIHGFINRYTKTATA